MGERGIDITAEFPKPWTDEIVQAADVVITMGCGDSCPLYPGKRYLDGELEDPAGKSVDEVRPVHDEIERRVRHLLDQLQIPHAADSMSHCPGMYAGIRRNDCLDRRNSRVVR